MKYADRDGNIYEEENFQDRFLKLLYSTFTGRLKLKILIRPWVSKLGGAFLSSPFSKCMIRSFIKKNKIDMNQYETKNIVHIMIFYKKDKRRNASSSGRSKDFI